MTSTYRFGLQQTTGLVDFISTCLAVVIFTSMPAGADGAKYPNADACAGFLRSLYRPELGLVLEYPGAKVAWLSHDNLLAAHALRRRDPKLATAIQRSIQRHSGASSAKLAPVLGVRISNVRFLTHSLQDVARTGEWVIKTEREVEPELSGWHRYADLLLLRAMGLARDRPHEAKRLFQQALEMWDGVGFMDSAAKAIGRYSAFKLALALMAGRRLRIAVPQKETMLSILRRLQHPSGGIVTDYDAKLTPIGVPNAETTALVLLALDQPR
ncbi:MAG: hypothetical protein ACUVTZ_06715 [Armatimonadota bacterium]